MVFRSWRNLSKRKREAPSTMQKQMLWGFVLCSLAFLIALSTWYVTRLPVFTIDEIRISGGITISHAELRTRIENILVGDYISLIPHRFFLLYPENEIQTTLERIPRIHSVTTNITDRKTLEVNFKEYTPYALWCLKEVGVPQCYFINEHGFAFAESPQLEGGSFVRHIFDEETTLTMKQIIVREELYSLHQFLNEINQKLSLRVTDVLHTKDGDVNLKINGGGEIRFAKKDTFEEILKNLTSVLESSTFEHLAPGNFQYIDLRFGKKIFVNEEEPQMGTTTEDVATSTDI